ncbi:MAG: Gx transporter family protein [Lachnospiraceae bacterium]|nr:Gx transporter family protein [Lachnospiraceae bacterium]
MKANVAKYGVLVALAFIFSYIETLIPFEMIGIPGIKLGLANLVVVVAMYTMRTGDAFVISLVRIVLVGFTFGNLYSAVYGLCGGLLSFAVMVLIKKADWFGIVGVSLTGGIFHNIGQLIVAVLVVENVKVAYYFPPLLIAGAITGTVIGIVAGMIARRLKQLY